MEGSILVRLSRRLRFWAVWHLSYSKRYTIRYDPKVVFQNSRLSKNNTDEDKKKSESKRTQNAIFYKNLKWSAVRIWVKGKGKVQPCTRAEALYRLYGPYVE